MGFYRLLKGELNKILMRPILYVITAVVVFAIIFSYFQFDPKSRDEYTQYYSVYSDQDTLVKVKKTFNDPSASNSFGALAADQLITHAENELESAKQRSEKTEPDERDIIEYLNYLIGEHREPHVSEPDDFLSAYNTYMNDQSFKGSTVNALMDALANVVGNIKPTKTTAPITPSPAHESNNLAAIHYYITNISDLQKLPKKQIDNPDILVLTEKLKEFNDMYIKVYNNIISEDRPNEYDITKKENHASIREFFKENNVYAKLCEIADCIKIKTISNEIYETRKKNLEEAKKYLVSLKADINKIVEENDSTQINKLKDLCVKYYLYALNTNRLINNTATYDKVIKMSDQEASSYFGYSTMSMNNGDEQSLYLYAIQETITKEEFMLNSHSVESEYANVFNGNKTSNKVANAFDFVYFGLEITSIVIIIFTVVLAAGMLAGEQSTGTLKLLLIRPYSRSSILTSKLIATIIFASIFFIFSTIILFLIGWSLFGVNFAPVLAVFNGTSAFVASPVVMLLIYLLCLLLKTIFYIVISLAISAIFRSNVGAVSFSIVLYFLISIMGTIFATSFFYGFIPFSNLDLFKFFGGSFATSGTGSLLATIFSSSIFHGVGFWYSFGINLALIAIITVCSYFIFKKREVK